MGKKIVEKLYERNPDVFKNNSGKTLSSAIKNFMGTGLSFEESLDLIQVIHPQNLAQTELMAEALYAWMSFCQTGLKMKSKQAIYVLKEDVGILGLPPEEWTTQLEFLKENLPSVIPRKIILHNPKLLTMNEKVFLQQRNFLIEVMHVHPRDIVESKAITFDFDELKYRYAFLSLSGIYKHPKSKIATDKIKAFPSIFDIVKNSRSKFIQACCNQGRPTLEEYEAFRSLFDIESNDFAGQILDQFGETTDQRDFEVEEEFTEYAKEFHGENSRGFEEKYFTK